MLKIIDQNQKVKFVLRDSDDEPVSIDELVLQDDIKQKKDKNKKRLGKRSKKDAS